MDIKDFANRFSLASIPPFGRIDYERSSQAMLVNDIHNFADQFVKDAEEIPSDKKEYIVFLHLKLRTKGKSEDDARALARTKLENALVNAGIPSWYSLDAVDVREIEKRW